MNEDRIYPEIAFQIGGESPVYKCQCGLRFKRMDLLKNKKIKGTRLYCPRCKRKFIFSD